MGDKNAQVGNKKDPKGKQFSKDMSPKNWHIKCQNSVLSISHGLLPVLLLPMFLIHSLIQAGFK